MSLRVITASGIYYIIINNINCLDTYNVDKIICSCRFNLNFFFKSNE